MKQSMRALWVLSLMAMLTACCDHQANIRVIGPTALIKVSESGITYHARIDTGAVETSLHATDFVIDDESENKKENVGKTIHFTTLNEDNMSQRISSTITKTSRIRNSQGEEVRYMVELTLKYNGESKKVEVNLRDRTRMSYKLLIGRNWLENNYLVDVSQPLAK